MVKRVSCLLFFHYRDALNTEQSFPQFHYLYPMVIKLLWFGFVLYCSQVLNHYEKLHASVNKDNINVMDWLSCGLTTNVYPIRNADLSNKIISNSFLSINWILQKIEHVNTLERQNVFNNVVPYIFEFR